MTTKAVLNGGVSVAVVNSDTVLIDSVESALDFMFSVKHETGCDRIAVNKAAICEGFFILSSGVAGEILQKFINYHMKFAVIGDYSRYTSKPLKAFLYESNNGKDIFFTKSESEAVERLSRA